MATLDATSESVQAAGVRRRHPDLDTLAVLIEQA
jgi:hypothetical protein